MVNEGPLCYSVVGNLSLFVFRHNRYNNRPWMLIILYINNSPRKVMIFGGTLPCPLPLFSHADSNTLSIPLRWAYHRRPFGPFNLQLWLYTDRYHLSIVIIRFQARQHEGSYVFPGNDIGGARYVKSIHFDLNGFTYRARDLQFE